MNRPRFLVIFLLTIHGGLLAWSAATMTATFDEPAHLAAGWYTWQSGQCNLYTVNPPLVKTLAASPLLLVGAETDWSELSRPPSRGEIDVGDDFVRANGSRIHQLIRYARWACLPFSLIGAWGCYVWSHKLFGVEAGITALILWCFSPTILGNGALITADVAAGAAGVLAGFSFWYWLRQPSWERAFLNGAALGFCWLVKLTWVILPAIWLIVWLVSRCIWRLNERHMRTELLQGSVSVLIGLAVLNAGYALEGTFTPLKDFQFHSSLLNGLPAQSPPRMGNRFEGTWLGEIPVPVPSSFVYGLDAQRQDLEEPRTLYFAGQRSQSGWWYFYIAAIPLKEPLGFLLLGLIAAIDCWYRRNSEGEPPGLIAVWLPPLCVLLLVSSQTQLNNYRYLMPAFPYAVVFVSRVGRFWNCGRRLTRAGFVLALLSVVWSGISSVPHSLSYVNVLGGGTRNGHWWFSDCNYDWGQDLHEVKRWQKKHPEARPLHLAYFGVIHPDLAGIEFEAISRSLTNPSRRKKDFQIPPGWYAVSVSHVHGVEKHTFAPDGRYQSIFNAGLTVFESEEPVGRAGPSILIYHID
jgi:hypothetical protein